MRKPRRLTYANVMSTIAVFLVLGGATAFAASHLGKNSVGTMQLKNNAVVTAKIKNSAVTGAKVADGSLSAEDLAPGTIPSIPTPTPRTARLQSGETITGFVAIEQETSSPNDVAEGAGFQILPPAPVTPEHWHLISGGSGPGCPGVGRADPGNLCVYQTDSENATNAALFNEDGRGAEAASYGFVLQVDSVSAGIVIYYAVWAYTAP